MTRLEEDVMAESDPAALGLLALRVVLGVVMIAHGWNHIFGGGRIAGTARWFESLGMRPGRLHAWTASVTELGAGVLLVLGLLTPFAGAAVIGLMVVALVTNHLKNGFFIFRPGEGYEYVLVLIAAGILLAATGGGTWSLDGVLDVFQRPGWATTALALAAGFGGSAALLAACWRPPHKAAEEPAASPTST